jgi:superfamily II DNA or RNA helicase
MPDVDHFATQAASSASRGLASLPLRTEYRTGTTDPVGEFYRPCLLQATQYDRAVGFFRSTVFLIIGQETIEFAKKGGKIRLICSPALNADDLDSINGAYAVRSETLAKALLSDIDSLLASAATSYRTQVLATLIKVGAMDVRLALRPSGFGLYHEKIGLFRDAEGNRVSFIGSANETWNGWHQRGNYESIEIFCDWNGRRETERVENHDRYFKNLWEGRIPEVVISEFPEAAKHRLDQASLPGLGAVDMEEICADSTSRTPLPHQLNAVDAWRAAGCRGIFEHATGSGKTFTALLAIKEHTDLGKPAIVLVPSQLLLEQWAAEIRAEVPRAALLIAGGGNDRWRRQGRLRGMTDAAQDLGPRIILATMQTAATDDFLAQAASSDSLLVVADEVHQAGSTFNSRVFCLLAGARLGLSATPERYGDPEGTARIFSYFGSVVPPPITLPDAIKAGRLVEYQYYPHAINLTAEEADEWRAVTQQIRFELSKTTPDTAGGPHSLSEKAKLLLIRRSRIAKKAAAKVGLAINILRANFDEGQHWLVYCEDRQQLDEVLVSLRSNGMNPVEYHSAMSDADREATLSWFRSFGGILVSIKCLDEGVDIPAVSHGLILASSQNPRQFIQRRGRVLRKAPGKHLAVIHDAIVVPVSPEDEPEQLSLLKSEFLRAIAFADSALNRGAAAELRRISTALGIDPDLVVGDGIEDEEQ